MLFYASVGVKMALLREGLRGLLHDGIPQSSSHPVTTSRKAAEELLDWTAAEANADRSESFTSEVVQLLDKALDTTIQYTNEIVIIIYDTFFVSEGACSPFPCQFCLLSCHDSFPVKRSDRMS